MRGWYRSLPATSTALLVLALAGCSGSPTAPGAMMLSFDFSGSPQGFVAGFADYPPADESIYALRSGHLPLPPATGASGMGLFISGINRSDDLFMYYKGRITGLTPATMYLAGFTMELATNAPSGCVGVGGAPGESVYLKAGITQEEPVGEPVGGQLRMNIDKGNQANGGTDAVVLGNVANSRTCEQGPEYELKTVSSGGQEVMAETDSQGRLWLLFGSDSGFESLTALWYTRVDVSLTPVG